MTEKEQEYIFKSWLDQYKGLIFKIIRAYTATAMDRDDLFQDVAIQVWRSIPSFRNESAVSTWLYRISLNTALKWSKKERKFPASASLDHVVHILQEQTVTVDGRLNWLYEQIQQLDEIDRSIALLLLDNFSYKEMAAMLGITESNVGVKINRIKKHLISKSKKYTEYGI